METPDDKNIQHNGNAQQVPDDRVVTMESVSQELAEQELEDGLTIVKSPEGLSVSVDGYGFRLGKKSERMVVKKADGKTVWQFPLDQLSDVFVLRNGSFLSTDLIAEAAVRGVSLHVIEPTGRPVAQLQSPALTATIETRRAQIQAETTLVGRQLAAAFVAGKVLNQSRLLRYCWKYLNQTDAARAEHVRQAASELLRLRRQMLHVTREDQAEFREVLMGFEGSAANRYWDAVGQIIRDRAEFPGRHHRGASDPVNCMLNYGYGILYAQVWSAVLRAGLEPFAGFLHADRPGKPSLVLDLTEEFRAPVVDRTVIAAVNLGQIAEIKDGRMTQESRAALADKILKRLDSREVVGGKEFQIRSIVQMQARRVASFLRGKNTGYRAFRFRW